MDSEEYHEGNLKLEELFDPENSYVIRIKGDSMKNASILDGDLVIVNYQCNVKSGDIVIAVVDGETTVKRILYNENNIILQPENENYSQIVINPHKTKFFLCGKVVGVVRKM